MRPSPRTLRRFFHSLFTRVLLIGAAVVLLGTVTRSLLLSGILLRDTEVSAGARQQAFASHVAHDLEQKIALRQETLRRLARALPPQLLDDPQGLRDWLRERHDLLPLFSPGLIVADRDGRVIASDPPGAAPFVPGPDAAEALERPVLVESDGQPALSIAVPLRGPVGQVRATLRGVTALAMPGFIDQLASYRNGQSGGYLLVFPQDRLYLAASDPALALKAIPEAGIDRLIDRAVAGDQRTDLAPRERDDDEIAARAPVPGSGWSVIAHLPADEALRPVHRTLVLMRNAVPLILAFALTLMGVALHFTLRPLSRAARHADRMARGEIPLEPLPLLYYDEFADLVAAFNRLLGNLSEQARELTLQKEIAETATLAKSRFLAAASHDLRQPMYALNLYLGALAGFDLPPAARTVMTSVRQCAQTMDAMFSALLDISRLDAQVIRPELRVFPIAGLLDKIEIEFVRQALAKGLTLRVAACSAHVLSDPEFLERILRNLVSNAVRYTERGTILVGCRRTAGGLRLCVHDTGPGIAVDQQRAVFEAFYQIGNCERDRAQGLGLGLSIVHQLALLLDAPLRLKSSLGHGSTFSLDLKSVPAGRSLPVVPARGADRGLLAGALIAVIDDEPLIVDATRVLLEQRGCTVVTASGGAEAMERLAACPRVPDAIVCDHRLRGNETGVDVIAALRAEFNHDIPALLVTGDTSPERIKALVSTRLPILHKPFQDGILIDTLAHLIAASPPS